MNSMNEKTMTGRKLLFQFFFNTTPQRTPKFPDPKKYGGTREKLESFKYALRVKLRASYDWYPTEDMKFNYAFSCLKNVARTQILFKMNEGNFLKFYSAEKLLRFLNVNFGDQNKKQTAQNKIRSLKMWIFFCRIPSWIPAIYKRHWFRHWQPEIFFSDWLFMGASETFGTTWYWPDDVRWNGFYLPNIMD